MFTFFSLKGTQVCHNCGIGTNCSVEINITWEITRDTECWELCINNTDCQAATLNSSSACVLYTCTQISQRIGGKAYRKTSNTGNLYVYISDKDCVCDMLFFDQVLYMYFPQQPAFIPELVMYITLFRLSEYVGDKRVYASIRI